MKIIFPFLLFFALFPVISNSQDSITPYSLPPTLSLDIDAEGFFFNTEYATPYTKGYTIPGFRLSPTIVYGINERSQLRVGFNAIMLAGLDSLQMFRPTLTLLYKPASWLTLIAGTLINDERRTENYTPIHLYSFTPLHQLPYPSIDPSRHYLNYQEDGIQILTNTKVWNSDTWLDWTHYLVPWTPDQELFTMGTRHIFTILNYSITPLHHYSLSIPAHFMASHRGGELKTIDTNTVTTFNESVGLRFNYTITPVHHYTVHQLTLDLPLFFYHLDNNVDHGGKAFYPTLSYTFTRLHDYTIHSSLGFWQGDHYFSALGDPLFWSINDYSLQHIPFTVNTQAFNPDIRNLLTYTLSFEHSFKGIALGLKVDALHDIDLKTNDFIFSFFLRYNGLFKIK